MFTGARLNELGQLDTSDIKEKGGVHYITVTDGDGKFLKGPSSRRDVPIHSELVRMGFLSFVEDTRKAGGGKLFPALKQSGRSVTEAWSKWWGRYARDFVPDQSKTFHSFRHTMKDALREAGVPAEIHHRLQGHAIGGEGAKYGSGYSISRLAEEMNKVHFPGLNLTHLHKE